MAGYRKFMILSSPRSGTHMLRTSVDQHPNAVCLTEMFNPDYTLKIPEYTFTEDTPAEEILRDFIFNDRPAEIQAVGFCLHRVGARFGNWPTLWETLADMKDLAILSLRRGNLLRRYWSYQIMKIQDLKNNPPPPRDFDKEKLIVDFERQEAKIAEFDEKFAGHALLPVTYEELCDAYAPTMRGVQEFLELPLVELQPGTPKRATPGLREAVSNYEQLQADFAGTRWAGFFDE